ncbi:MAG: Bor family protein [Longimicrobiales bacterium]|nr:Bor family protein [Longimicrobiales bacterium]
MSGTMNRSGAAVVSLAALLFAAGCFRHTIDVGGGAPAGPVVYDRWEHFWLGGLVGHTRVDVERICPSGQATIEARQSFLNGLVSGLTSGIYTPMTLKVRCRDGRRAALELSSEDVARIVADEEFAAWVAAELPERLAEVTEAQASLQQP